ncbi:MAG: threonine synthase [Proteobacteria bacterium]|jgi:threonine synthase|nr:threonine synthase [Pseudomonadota bacterium]
MRYVSTRGAWQSDPQPFRAILLEGLAPDGGLAVPERYPRFERDEIEALRGLAYPALATAVLARFVGDIAHDALARIVAAAYTREAFGSDDITPLVALEPGLSLLRLSNGPTLAFKDIALQLLGRLLEHALGGERVLNILGATSGDTGSSAEYAMRGKRGIAVFMLSPRGRMSAFQEAQMYSLDDPAIHNLAVEGTFDDCQDLVKALAGDAAFRRRHALGAVNSINWARIAAQVVYYFKGWLAATGVNAAKTRVSFAVPSGNFGNVLAGHVARSMGLPIERLIVATNENDVLDEFFRSGRYRPRGAGETHATSSPSMDISKASNFERYVYDVAGRDPQRLRSLWDELARRGSFDLHGTPLWRQVQESGFVSGRSTHADRVATIRDVHLRDRVLIDPHTADGVKVARELREGDEHVICLETALPAKFAATIREAVGFDPPRPAAWVDVEKRPQRFTVVANDRAEVAAYVAGHALAVAGRAA